MSRPQVLKRLVAAAVLVSLCSALCLSNNTRVRAANNHLSTTSASKISPDLRKLILSGNGNARVKVIVQSKPSTSPGLLGGLLNTVGGLLVGVLSNLNIRIVDVEANSVEVLATDPNVAYLSLDAPVRSSGHVTTTTGAQQVRAQKSLLGLNPTLDGSGVTIAVLDSGIDRKHKSFATSGKIKFSKDFTGENRTDDPWGHGTHVAAIAAGDGAPTGGAYEGIAPAANLVNLRVLNSQGVGKVSGVLAALDWLIANKNNYGVKVVNMSLGTPAINSYEDDPICNAVRKLVDAGVVVVAAAGNNGKDAKGRADLWRHSLPWQRTVGNHSRRQQQLRHRSAQRRRSDELQLTWSNPQLYQSILTAWSTTTTSSNRISSRRVTRSSPPKQSATA